MHHRAPEVITYDRGLLYKVSRASVQYLFFRLAYLARSVLFNPHFITMKSLALLAFVLTAGSALSFGKSREHSLGGQDVLSHPQYLVELSPGESKWIAEEEKWEMKRV